MRYAVITLLFLPYKAIWFCFKKYTFNRCAYNFCEYIVLSFCCSWRWIWIALPSVQVNCWWFLCLAYSLPLLLLLSLDALVSTLFRPHGIDVCTEVEGSPLHSLHWIAVILDYYWILWISEYNFRKSYQKVAYEKSNDK